MGCFNGLNPKFATDLRIIGLIKGLNPVKKFYIKSLQALWVLTHRPPGRTFTISPKVELEKYVLYFKN
jgi:hypothetical protein